MTPAELTVTRAEALFASDLQSSEQPCAPIVRAAVIDSLIRFGGRGCVMVVAREFGDHPDLAAARMAWALRMVRSAFLAGVPREPVRQSRPAGRLRRIMSPRPIDSRA
jgi:hypothetical protein